MRQRPMIKQEEETKETSEQDNSSYAHEMSPFLETKTHTIFPLLLTSRSAFWKVVSV